MLKKTITKNELVEVIINNSEITKADAQALLEDFFEVMIKNLEAGDEVRVSGFGNFILRDKAARIGRNPRTKEEFPIKARRVVSFHTSNLLKDKVRTINGLAKSE